MARIRPRYFDGVLGRRSVGFGLVLLTIAWAAVSPGMGLARSGGASQGKDDDPVYTNYRGVHIGATLAESRKALGDPKERSDGQDLYVFNEKEMATIYYDGEKKVTAISIDFIGDESKPPTPLQVVGSAIDAKPDGSIYKMVRYPKAGYWVSYNKTAGQSPLISVTLQKM